jgi:hypothetical protein
VRGILFFYELDFHNLAPNFILHLTTFIIICEVFLRMETHFGMWLKMFCVKPKSSGADFAKCGGAMISKLQKTDWLEGTFVETVRIWQREWFYITKPLAGGQAVAPTFTGTPSSKLVSWQRQGLEWGNPDEVSSL